MDTNEHEWSEPKAIGKDSVETQRRIESNGGGWHEAPEAEARGDLASDGPYILTCSHLANPREKILERIVRIFMRLVNSDLRRK